MLAFGLHQVHRRRRPRLLTVRSRWGSSNAADACLWLAVAEEVFGEERQRWWNRVVVVYPNYADCAEPTERTIPVFVARRTGGRGSGYLSDRYCGHSY